MMFITVTRHGGGRPLRLALGAIAWLDEADAGAVIRLTSGDGLHVAETVAEIEAAIAPMTMTALQVDFTEEQSELRQRLDQGVSSIIGEVAGQDSPWENMLTDVSALAQKPGVPFIHEMLKQVATQLGDEQVADPPVEAAAEVDANADTPTPAAAAATPGNRRQRGRGGRG